MNKVFGENNHIANVIWQKVYSPKNTAVHFSDDHEYVLVYAANRNIWRPNPLPRSAEQDKAYKNADNDPVACGSPATLPHGTTTARAATRITCPSGRVIDGAACRDSYWRVSRRKFDELDADNPGVVGGKDGQQHSSA